MDKIAANQNGAITDNWLSKPPIAGPSTNPIPKAAPISPIRLERFSGGVISAI